MRGPTSSRSSSASRSASFWAAFRSPFRATRCPPSIKLGLAGGPLIAAILPSYYGPQVFHLAHVHDRLRQPDARFRVVGPHVLPRKHGPGRRRHVHRGLRERHRSWRPHGARPRDQRRAHGRHGRRRAPLHAARHSSRHASRASSQAPRRSSLGAQLRQQPLLERGLAVLAYSTVYPLAMFLRIISGQIILMLFFSMQ